MDGQAHVKSIRRRQKLMDCRIEDKNGIRYLYSSESATQSAIDLQNPHKLILQNLEYAMGCLMFMSPPKNILVLGVAGGSLIHFFRHYLPKAHITGVDYDGDLLQTMHEQFLLPKADHNLSYEIADAQSWVKNNHAKFDLIIVDLFDEQNMPKWILEKGFMRDLSLVLNQQGCISWNTLIENDKDFKYFYSNLRATFKQRTLCLAAEDYENTIAYSFNYNLESSDMGYLIQLAHQSSEQYELPFHDILSIIFNTNPIDSGFI